MIATAFGFICKYLVLSYGSGFDYLALGLGVFFLPLALVMANPSVAPAALACAFVFCYVVQPDNLMVYDLSDSFNIAVAVLGGVLVGTLSYTILFPPNPPAARRYVTYRIRRGLEEMASANPIPHYCSWKTRMYDRVIRLYDPENPSASSTDEWLEAGLGAITLGNELLRLRHWLEAEKLPMEQSQTLTGVVGTFSHFLTEPQRAVLEVKSRIQEMSGLDPGPGGPDRMSWARILGALEEIDIYLARHPKLALVQ